MKRRTKATPRRRAQGRPNEGKNAVGPELLLKAARELLEILPPAKVTRAALARHAGVDPNLIRYYFADRDSLLLSVVEQIVNDTTSAERPERQGTAPERLRSQVRAFLEFNTRYPFFHRLLVEEISNWKTARARQVFHRLNQSSLTLYTAILKDGAKDKSLVAVDPALLNIALIGMSEFFLGSRYLLEDAYGKGATPAEHAKRYADTVVQLVVEGIRTR
ncbi:MAG: TetR/AcrR family transcriptional regulator [Polyangiales bacterium]